jgi:signal transduction histidine kinase
MSERDKPRTGTTVEDDSDSDHSNAAERPVTTVIADYEAQLDDVAELVARVRHEINNPLAGILGQAQLLLREELNDKARHRAETIEQLATRLRDVVAQLREIQRPVRSFESE